MFDLISIGGATRDIFFEFDTLERKKAEKNHELYLEIPYGEKIVSDRTFYGYGGGAVNVAVCGSRLGLKTASLCQIGREGTGSLVVDFLRHERVNVSMVSRDSHLHTGMTVLILGSDGEHTGFLERGANNHLAVKKRSAFKKSKWLYVSSLTGSSAKILPEVFEYAVENNVKIAFNPGSSQLAEGYGGLKQFLARTDILFLNYEEACQLIYSKTKKYPKNEKGVLSEIEKMGAAVSVVTDAGRGCHAVSEGKHYHEKSFSTAIVDTTGAGDSFGGTFVFCQMEGYNIQKSLKIASINAASVISKMGSTAGLLTKNAIMNSKWL